MIVLAILLIAAFVALSAIVLAKGSDEIAHTLRQFDADRAARHADEDYLDPHRGPGPVLVAPDEGIVDGEAMTTEPERAPELSDGELAEIEARAAAATEGPWEADGSEIYDAAGDWVGESLDLDAPDGGETNARFAAAARTDVPRLVAALRAAREERDQAQAIVVAARSEAAIVQETRAKLLKLADEIAGGPEMSSFIANKIRLLLVRPIYMPGEEFEEVSDRG